MRDGCPFCDYDGPSQIHRKGQYTYTIEPLRPVVPGHLLIVPWAHIEDAGEEPFLAGRAAEDAAWTGKTMNVCFNLITSAGSWASQSVRHLHWHYVPRFEGDGVLLPWSDPGPPPRAATLAELATAKVAWESERLRRQALRRFVKEALARKNARIAELERLVEAGRG